VVEERDYNLPDLGSSTRVERTSTKERTSGNLDYMSEFEWESDDGKDSLKMSVGADLRYKYYVPDYIEVLSIRAENELFDDYLVHSKVDINTKRQKAEISVIDGNDNEELFSVTARGSKASLSVPYDVDIFEDYYLKGRVGFDTNGEQNIRTSFMDGNDELFSAGYSQNTDGEEIIQLGASRNITTNGVLSLKLEKRSTAGAQEDSESAWITYNLRF
jgi:hypothetical protein